MELNSKYSINDTVWVAFTVNEIIKCKVIGVHVEITGEEIKIPGNKRDLIKTGEYQVNQIRWSYDLKTNVHPHIHNKVSEKLLYNTKEDLKSTLISKLQSL